MKRWEMVRVSHLSISFDDYRALQSKHHNIPVRTLKSQVFFISGCIATANPTANLGRIIGILANLTVTHCNLSPIAWLNRIRFFIYVPIIVCLPIHLVTSSIELLQLLLCVPTVVNCVTSEWEEGASKYKGGFVWSAKKTR